MTYLESGQKRFREENFNIMHAQNISPTTGFNVDYKARGTRGQYIWSRTKNHNLSVAFSHTGKRYSVHAAYYNNHIEQQENGGVVGTNGPSADTTFQMPSGVPMKLSDAEAQNTYRNNAFFITQSYALPLQRVTENDFSLADLSAVYHRPFVPVQYRGARFIRTNMRRVYRRKRRIEGRDRAISSPPIRCDYYQNWYHQPRRRRATRFTSGVISNRFFVQAQPWDRNGVVGTIDGRHRVSTCIPTRNSK